MLRDASLDTNVVIQNKQNKLKTVALIRTFFFSLLFFVFCSFFCFNNNFLTAGTSFVLSFSLFQQQHKGLVQDFGTK
jgi:hypothetical protein